MEIEEQGNGSSKNNSNFLCRQSSTRWTPTTDQIRILKDLYYNNGVRSPTAEQIQRISAKLRQYGKIEGKNVFYWFQNHKARERQKKRFSVVPEHHQYMNIPMHKPLPVWRNNNVDEHHLLPIYNNNNNFTNTTAGSGGGTSGGGGGGFSTGGYNFGNYGPSYGSMAMEKSFRDCSIAAGGGSLGQSSISWVGVNHDPYPNYYPFLDNQKSYFNGHDKTLETDQEDDEENTNTITEIETLPLFPTQHGGAKLSGSGGAAHVDYFNAWLQRRGSDVETCPRASLELTLNSCFTNFTN